MALGKCQKRRGQGGNKRGQKSKKQRNQNKNQIES